MWVLGFLGPLQGVALGKSTSLSAPSSIKGGDNKDDAERERERMHMKVLSEQ